jgi:hypothetical protein
LTANPLAFRVADENVAYENVVDEKRPVCMDVWYSPNRFLGKDGAMKIMIVWRTVSGKYRAAV